MKHMFVIIRLPKSHIYAYCSNAKYVPAPVGLKTLYLDFGVENSSVKELRDSYSNIISNMKFLLDSNYYTILYWDIWNRVWKDLNNNE